MILGPFWCESDNCWVRFIVENGVVRAEIAKRSEENPRLTTPWEATTKDHWQTNYSDTYENVDQVFYSLQSGVLYSTVGEVNKITDILESMVFKNGGWMRNTKRDESLFSNYSLKDRTPPDTLTAYKELPLTPEKEEALIRLAQEEERKRREQEKAKWEACKKEDIRYLGLQEAGRDIMFDNETLIFLYDELSVVLVDYHIGNYESCQDYLYTLKTIIEDPNCPQHQAIVNAASRTHIDRVLQLNDDERMRDASTTHKKTFFFNLLRIEVRHLRSEFQIDCPLLSPEEITARATPVLTHLNDLHPPFYPGSSLAGLGACEAWYLDPLWLEEDDDAAAGLRRLRYAFVDDNFVGGENSKREIPIAHYERALERAELLPPAQLLDSIKDAITQGHANYKAWYEDDGSKEIRGRDGFFSRWSFRHSASGQRHSLEIRNRILGIDDLDEAMREINAVLREGAIDRHSKVSFYLDELRKIEGGPWEAIPLDETGLYKRSDIINNLFEEELECCLSYCC